MNQDTDNREKTGLVKTEPAGKTGDDSIAGKVLRTGLALFALAASVVGRKRESITPVKQDDRTETVETESISDSQRAVLDVHLEEYKQLTTEIRLRVEFQQKLTHYQLIAAAVIGTIGVRITQLDLEQILQSEPVRYYLLLTPLVFLVFSWMFSNNDLMIMAVARYVSTSLTPKIRTILDSNEVLGFESFLQEDRRTLVRRYGLLGLIGQEFALQLVLPVLFILIYLYLYSSDLTGLWGNIKHYPLALLLLMNVVLYVLTFQLRWKIWNGYKNLTP